MIPAAGSFYEDEENITSVGTLTGNNLTGTWTIPSGSVAGSWNVSVNQGGLFSNDNICFTILPDLYTINATADRYTIVYPHGIGTFLNGSQQTYLTEAKPGSDLLNITVDEYPYQPARSWTFHNISADHTISTTGQYIPGQVHAFFSMNRTVGKAPLAVSFTDLSAGDPLSFSWQFGDGYTSTDRNPVHVYQTPGIYTVTLRARNNQSGRSEIWNNAINVTAESG